jgi:hypothetical protein
MMFIALFLINKLTKKHLLRLVLHMHVQEKILASIIVSIFMRANRKPRALLHPMNTTHFTLLQANRKETNKVPIGNEGIFMRLTFLLSHHATMRVSLCLYTRHHVYLSSMRTSRQVWSLLFIAYICKYFMIIGEKQGETTLFPQWTLHVLASLQRTYLIVEF